MNVFMVQKLDLFMNKLGALKSMTVLEHKITLGLIQSKLPGHSPGNVQSPMAC